VSRNLAVQSGGDDERLGGLTGLAIDVWSAGIMLLSILTHKFPIFNSNDDMEALMEIAAIFGRASMERCAMLHSASHDLAMHQCEIKVS
jgi:cell division control protein 7